jgi:hypothetical protein
LTLGLGVQSAQADVDVFAFITKDKDITIIERLDKIKTVIVHIDVVVVPDKAAESLALVNQANYDNEACENCAEKSDVMINSIGGLAGFGNSGIVTVNQASGNMNNQGNNLAVAVDFRKGVPGTPTPPTPPAPGDNPGYGFAEAQASTDQKNGAFNAYTTDAAGAIIPAEDPNLAPNFVDTVNLFFRDALIDTSINNNDGVVLVNQAPGNMNNQANNISIAISIAEFGGVALAEADLGQLTVGNFVRESDSTGTAPFIGINKSARVVGSMVGNTGIIAANQAAGNMSNQSNTLAIAVVTTF